MLFDFAKDFMMRIQFTRPLSLEGKQLQDELAAVGISADFPSVDFEGNLWLNIDVADETKTAEIIAAHIAAPIVLPTPAEKLFSATGLTVAEYKALGL